MCIASNDDTTLRKKRKHKNESIKRDDGNKMQVSVDSQSVSSLYMQVSSIDDAATAAVVVIVIISTVSVAFRAHTNYRNDMMYSNSKKYLK